MRWRWLLHDALPLIIMFSVLLLAGGAYAAYLDERKAVAIEAASGVDVEMEWALW